jgi:hypothetical protein
MGQDREAAAPEDADEAAAGANVNQVRHEPIPASHHEDRSQQAVSLTQEHSGGQPADRDADPDGGEAAAG